MILLSSNVRLALCSGYATSSWLLIFTVPLSQHGTVYRCNTNPSMLGMVIAGIRPEIAAQCVVENAFIGSWHTEKMEMV